MTTNTSKRWKYGPPETTSRRPDLGDNKSGIMDSVSAQLNKYKDPLMTGGLAVVFGLAARKFMKMDNISTGSLKQAGVSFLLVALAGVASQEIDNKYP